MDHAYDDDEKCRSCGKSYAMHGMVTDLCPGAGDNTWVNTMFERLPARPTGPTLKYVCELEAELLAMKAEMTTLALKADELVMELTGVDSPEDNPLVDTLPASISMVVYELMELAHLTLAAAKEAQS